MSGASDRAVALLGCGVGRRRGGPAAARAGRRPRRPGRRAAGARRHRRAPARPRTPTCPPDLLTTDAAGAGQARRRRRGRRGGRRHRAGPHLLLTALGPARAWSRANKALLAEDGATLHDAAAEGGADLYYEAAVAGAIPLLRPLRESLPATGITRVTGIVNGTTNFILSRMDATGAGFAEALDEATALGYAEADPTADVEGFDAAAKAAILASLAFHTRVTAADVLPRGHHRGHRRRRGQRQGDGLHRQAARHRERTADGAVVGVRVHPAMIPRTHPLAGVGDAFNAVFVEAEAAGQLMFYGRGAGGAPTASAVLGDLVAVARNRLAGGRGPGESAYADLPSGRWARPSPATTSASTWPTGRACWPPWPACSPTTTCRIQTVRQEGRGDDATLVIVTHGAPDAALAATVEELRGAGHRPRVASVHAGRRATDMTELTAGHGARGLARPRSRRTGTGCRSPTRTPVVTLHEGNTPLLPAPALSERTGCDVYLKVEGANPTGSFKDRGMTVAVSKAVEAGRKAIICASTGNTSASAAAYAARAGLTCAVLVPQGKIALGKLAQALVHGARLLQVEGNFDDCLALARELAERLPGRAGQLGQPGPHRGPEDRGVRDRRRARRRPRHPLPAGRQRRQHHRLLAGLPRVRRGRQRRPDPADVRLPGRRRRADRRRRAVVATRDHRHRHPDRQPGVVDRGDRRARRVRRR